MSTFRRWTDDLHLAARQAWSDRQRFTLLSNEGDIEHWDWDVSTGSWRLLRQSAVSGSQSEAHGYTDYDVISAILHAVAFGGIND